jgi:hypothetical protein
VSGETFGRRFRRGRETRAERYKGPLLETRDGELLLHLVNNSGDMRRPINHIYPAPGVRIELPGVSATSVCSARGTEVTLEAGSGGAILQLDLTDQYDILTIGTA